MATGPIMPAIMDDAPSDCTCGDAGAPGRYADWKAPGEDGQFLVWPAAEVLLRETADNGRHLRGARSALVQNVPLPDVRARLRQFLGHSDDDVPLVATGHQTELHHPGVWAKNALIDAVATKLGGWAYHFAVDTDAPKHLSLRWPDPDGSPGGSEPLTDDPAARTGRWSGLLDPPTPAHLARIAEEFGRAAAGWDFRPLVPDFLASLRRLSLESTNLSSALTNALHELDWNLGLRHHALLVSPVCESEPYLVFVHHLLARADRFAADYNGSLAEHRREYKIRSPGRPMPDLTVTVDRCEVPFWLDDLSTGGRSRAAVTRAGDTWAIVPPGDAKAAAADAFRFDPAADGWDAAGRLLAWLRRHGLRLSPRALTLTAVLRLLAADQFVHGIGGARYDQVLDRLICRHFGTDPPRFAVTTATLYFPAAVGQARACVPCVRHEGHRLRHSVLGADKLRLVEAIAAAPRRSPERAALFHTLHDRLAAAGRGPALQRWERQVRETAEREQRERVLFDRELFYAVQPADRLAEMIGRYRGLFG